jgi:chromosome partitioning protein
MCERGGRVTRVIATINLKGGVGKTTMTVALAEILSEVYGLRVLVIDLDPPDERNVHADR